MQTIEIAIGRGEVMEEVATMSEYVGAKRNGGEGAGAYERIGATDEALEELGRLLVEAAVGAERTLGHRVANAEVSVEEADGSVVLRIGVPDGVDGGVADGVRAAVRGYLVGVVLAGWLGICGETELAQGYAAQGVAALGEGVGLLNRRKRARRQPG